ncbi:MAG: DUF1292 domain-containing protein [Clostridia bacterium]|jgi:uncharacterized protein YrzB (UPF0473 family)
MTEEERDDIVVLLDEDGKEVEFEYLDTIEMNEEDFVVLLPLDENQEEQEEGGVVILKIEQNEKGEDTFISIDDEKLLTSVFEEFKSRMSEEYDFEE